MINTQADQLRDKQESIFKDVNRLDEGLDQLKNQTNFLNYNLNQTAENSNNLNNVMLNMQSELIALKTQVNILTQNNSYNSQNINHHQN